MIYRTIGMAVLALPAWFLCMRYNVHMLQLNGYKSGEHLRRTLKTAGRQWLLMLVTVIGAVRLVFHPLWLDIVCACCLLFTAFIYNLMRKAKAKKKLVYTARVKRLLTAHTVLCIAIPLLIWFLWGLDHVNGGILLVVGLQWILLILSNLLMKPAEKAVGNHYIRDAKRKLRDANMTVVGITGSYGKTSVKFYLEKLLSVKYQVLVTPESFNTPMGVVRTIRERLRPGHEIFLCEMGARHVGDIKEICDIVHPKHGIITSVGPQHLETFFTLENVKNTKFELADALPADGMLFLNGDNEAILSKAPEYPGAILYHAGGASDGYRAEDIKVSSLGTEFTVVTPEGERQNFSTRLVGGHNVINVVGAIAAANRLGVPLSDLIVPVRRLEPVEHRMQLIERGAVTIIDDAYNSNPVGSKAAVETLAMFDGVRILITPGMVELGEKEEEFNRAFGGYAAKCCDYICLVGRKRAVPIAEGAKAAGFPEEKLKIFDRLNDAVSFAYTAPGEGRKYILLENDLPDNY